MVDRLDMSTISIKPVHFVRREDENTDEGDDEVIEPQASTTNGDEEDDTD